MTVERERMDEPAGSPRAPAAPTEPSLRIRAEEKARTAWGEDAEALSAEGVRSLLHELRVHQIELEMQNEELRRAQEALEASHARYFDLYDLAPVGYCTLSEQGQILEANLTAATLLGVARHALVNQPLTRLIVAEDQDLYYRHRKHLFETGEPQACELRMVRTEGSTIWVRLQASAARDGESGAQVCRVVMSDITERVQAQAALRQVQELNESIVHQASEGILMTDAQGNITLANPALAGLVGRRPEELVGQPWTVLVAPDQQPLVWAADERRAAGQTDRYELSLRRRSPEGAREPAPVLVSGSPRYDPRTGHYAGSLAVMTDITERKQAEQEIRRLVAELEQRVEERTRALREAQERMARQERLAALGQLAGGVAHELRNPLGILSNAVYLLKLIQPDADGRVKEYLDILAQETKNAGKIITDLLEFSGVEPGEREPIAAPTLVQRVLERYPAPNGVSVAIQFAEGLPLAYADSQQVVQVLGNLVINAYHAMAGSGRLTVSAAEEQGMLSIAVSDSGVGIPAENLGKIFEPLYTTKAKGIGLGLPVSKKLAEANEGRIEVHSQPGRGATFTLLLPCAPG